MLTSKIFHWPFTLRIQYSTGVGSLPARTSSVLTRTPRLPGSGLSPFRRKLGLPWMLSRVEP